RRRAPPGRAGARDRPGDRRPRPRHAPGRGPPRAGAGLQGRGEAGAAGAGGEEGGGDARPAGVPDPSGHHRLRDLPGHRRVATGFLGEDSMMRLVNGIRRLREEERGDVPGWVLITLMTAGLVVVIWAIAGPALSGVFEQAIERVTGF